MIKFSVIVPNYNHANFLEQRLDSILQQTYQHFELIILDDHSTDSSRDIIEKYRGHQKVAHVIYNERNSGSPFRQWKKGFEVATGDWIWIAESDDFADPLFLEGAVANITRHPSAGIHYFDAYILNSEMAAPASKFSTRKNIIFNSRKWDAPYFNNGLTEINECLKFDCTINNTSSMVFKRTVLDAITYEADEFDYYGDWYFILQLAQATDILYDSRPLNFYRKHPASHLNAPTSILTSRYEYFRILQWLCGNKNVTEKKILINHFAFYYLGFGILTDGITTGIKILRSYFKADPKLARKALAQLMLIKILRRKPVRYKNWLEKEE